MACISNALIIGGGIAGLAAAISLAKAGVQCDVVEWAQAPLGASLALAGRAAEALDELGIYEECYYTGTPFLNDSTAASMSDAQGRLISAGPERPTWPGAKTAIGVYRPVFLHILEDAAVRAGVTIKQGITTRTIDIDGETSSVTFTDGTQSAYDLVIGADGIASRTRGQFFPDAPKPAYSGQMSIRWMAPGPAIPGEGWFAGPLGRVGFYYLPQGLVYVAAAFSAPEGTWLEGTKLYDFYARLLDTFTAPPMLELRQRLTPEAKLICRPYDWIFVPGTWHIGRVLLIGDAAHATTSNMGMGGGMALEDGVVLGQCMRAASTLNEALSQFMQRRYERVRLVVETSVALSRLDQAKAPRSESMALFKSAFQTLGQPY
jgi:2-polyprenyl-6-methoxyphenol hydroxylase-like FAD-dependent oxidoreductase